MKDREYILKRVNKIKNEYKKVQIFKWALRGIVLSFLLVLIYLFTIAFTSIIFSQITIAIIFILPILLAVIFSIKKEIPEKKVIKRADKEYGVEEMLITYLDYRDKSSDNPFLEPLEKQLVEIIKRIPREKIFKLKWDPELQLIGLLIAAIIFMTSWFNIGNVEMTNKMGSENIIDESNKIEKEVSIEKIELLDPLKSSTEEEKDTDIKSSDLADREKIKSGNSNQELNRKMDEGESEKNEEEDMSALKDRLEKMEKDNIGSQSQAEIDGLEGEKKENEDKSYLWDDNENRDRLANNEDNVFKKGEEEKEKQNESKDTPGPSEKEGDNKVNNQEKNYNVMDEQKSGKGESDLKNEQQGGGGQSSDSEKTGANPGGQEDKIEYKDDFANLDKSGKTAKLKSQLSNESYLNTFLKENYTPQNIAASDNLLDSYLQHRNFLLDALREENIPSYYKEMVRDYFTIIKD
ncbi:MAG: hypothetical protein ACQEQF_03120 [Bacillota bacterium]